MLHVKRITDQELSTTFIIRSVLGKGAFATVYEVETTSEPPQKYALKAVNMGNLSPKSLIKLETEIMIHAKLNHKSIVKLYRTFTLDNVPTKEFEMEKNKPTKNYSVVVRNYTFFVMELCSSSSLNDLLKNSKVGYFSEKVVKNLCKQVIEAILYMHEKSIIHRDIKLSNVFIKDKMMVKVGDFGLSAEIPPGGRKTTVCGTPNYIAPEILKYNKENLKGHSFEVDAWSVGILIYTMLVGKSPFSTNSAKEIYKKIKNSPLEFFREISSEGKDLLLKLLDKTPEKRMTLSEALNHPFFCKSLNPLSELFYKMNKGETKLVEEKNIKKDFIDFSLFLSSKSAIGVKMKSGAVGVYFNDHTSIYVVPKNNISITDLKSYYSSSRNLGSFNPDLEEIIYFVTVNKENRKRVKKENYDFIPEELKERVQMLLNFRRTFCTDLTVSPLEFSFITRVKRIDCGYLFGLYNNNLIFDFVNGRCVVEDLNKIYVTDSDSYDRMAGCLLFLKTKSD